MLAYVMFPDSMTPIIRRCAKVGALITPATAAVQLSRSSGTGWPRRAKPAEAAETQQQALLTGLQDVGSFVGSFVSRVSGSSLLLRLGGAAWSGVSPDSHRMAHALVGLLAVAADYNSIGSQAAAGRIARGKAVETAWHAAHKRAAQRLAPFLGDLPSSPPLAAAAALLDRLSVCTGLKVDGSALLGMPTTPLRIGGGCEAAVTPGSYGAATAGGSSGELLSLALSLRLTKRRIVADDAAQSSYPHSTSSATPNYANAAAVPISDVSAAPAPAPVLTSSVLDTVVVVPACDVGSLYQLDVTPADMPVPPTTSEAAAQLGDPLVLPVRVPHADPFALSIATPSPPSDSSVTVVESIDGDFANSIPAASSVRGEYGTVGDESPSTLDSASALSAPQRSPFAAAAGAASTAAGAHKPKLSQSVAGPIVPAIRALPATKPGVKTAVPPPLPLYGRGDHAGEAAAEDTSFGERVSMALRAVYLLAVFLPFLLIGVPLIVTATWLERRQSRLAVAQRRASGGALLAATAASGNGVALIKVGGAGGAGGTSVTRGLGMPLVAAQSGVGAGAHAGKQQQQQQPQVTGSGGGDASQATTPVVLRTAAWRLLLSGCRSSGAAFIKWGQWAAARGDMFPPDFQQIMSALHDDAPTHSWAHTVREVESSFGRRMDDIFVTISSKSLASGSVAQVHLATMLVDGVETQVAVKVRHPNVATNIARDFRILKPLAVSLSQFRALKGLSLKESVLQFSTTMTAQADLRVEAAHLARFEANFSIAGSQVMTPRLVSECVSESVLVETFEPGESVSKFMQSGDPLNSQIVALGVDAYLKMLLTDNFVHTDLHPGNIMVRIVDERGRVVPRSSAKERAATAAAVSTTAAADAAAASSTAVAARHPAGNRRRVRSGRSSSGSDDVTRAQLVLLDFGLAEELTPVVRRHFISFLNHICSGDGAAAARHILRWAAQQKCLDVDGFTADMVALFARSCNIRAPGGIDLDGVVKSVLQLARAHEVSIDSGYASLVLAVCVIVGFATALDPQVNLMDAAAPCLLAYSLTGRVIGRLYS